MSAQLSMNSGSRGVKAVVLGGIVLAFAVGIALLMRPGEPMQVAAQPAIESAPAAQAPAAAPTAPATAPETAPQTNP
jgi:hypothetical protein